MQMKLLADAKGDVAPQAWVTLTGSSVLRLRVREPKLTVKCATQEKVLVGDPAAFTLTVANPGDGTADQVKIHATLSEGLEHARGSKIDFDIGSLAPGESRIIRTYASKQAEGPSWTDFDPVANPVELTGNWKVSFLDGGPVLPPSFGTSSLGSWTDQKDDSYRNISGTAVYRLEFDLKEKSSAILDLGEIAHTAKVRINGEDAGTCWAPPHRLDVRDLLVAGKNVLEVEVTNLAANRIADLDRRKVQWKAFHEINFVNIDYKNFDASGWKPLPSGLLGPVKLIPVKAP